MSRQPAFASVGARVPGSTHAHTAGPSPTSLQRTCACGRHTTAGTTCDRCRGTQNAPRRADTTDRDLHAVALVSRVLESSSGDVLPESSVRWMQPHVDRHFGDAVSSGSRAAPRSIGPVGDALEAEADRFAELAARPAAPRADLVQPQTSRGIDLSAVRVHTSDRAAESAKAVHALAYTVGHSIVFDHGQYAPHTVAGRRLLAHELAHVAQQSQASASPAIQRYVEFTAADQAGGDSLGWKHPAGTKLRVSDDGVMACEDNGWGAGLSKRAWTVNAKVAESNTVLAAQGSRAEFHLKGGGQPISGKAPETKQDMSLEEIEPTRTGGGTLDLASDCGTACRQVTGSGPAGKKDVAVVGGGRIEPSGTIGGVTGGIGGLLGGGALGGAIGYKLGGTDPHNQLVGLGIGAAVGAIAGLIGGAYGGSALEKKIRGTKTEPERRLRPRSYHGGNPTTPEEWTEELFKKEFGSDLTREQAYQAYADLSDSEKDAFDRKYQINKYAVPKVGQGITISTEKDMPGFKRVSHHTWNFHYAASVFSSGQDFITLESAAGWAPTDWILFMYGPAGKKQSFYEFHGATHTHGTKYSAMVVEPEP